MGTLVYANYERHHHTEASAPRQELFAGAQRVVVATSPMRVSMSAPGGMLLASEATSSCPEVIASRSAPVTPSCRPTSPSG